jgi:hypothetical protein
MSANPTSVFVVALFNESIANDTEKDIFGIAAIELSVTRLTPYVCGASVVILVTVISEPDNDSTEVSTIVKPGRVVVFVALIKIVVK